jgi:hypothetical protein
MELTQQIEAIEALKREDKAHKELWSHVLKSLKRLLNADERAAKRAATKVDGYAEALELYFEFHEAVAVVKPMMNAAQGKALKDILLYLAANLKNEEATALDAWGYILRHWTNLTPFMQNQITLMNIRKNLPEILMQLRNGATASKKSQSGTARAKERIIRRAAGRHSEGDQPHQPG